MGENEPRPHLRGKLVPEQSLLRGSLLNKKAKVGSEDSGITMGATFIRRDGDEEYSVTGFTENRWGKKVNLTRADGKQRITLAQDDLEEKLSTEGSPWRRKVEKPESTS